MNAKLIDLKTGEEFFPDKVPLEELRKIWNDKEAQYTDEQLIRIRDWLYVMAEVIVRVSDRSKRQANLIPIVTPNENEKSHSIRTGEHRRAS